MKLDDVPELNEKPSLGILERLKRSTIIEVVYPRERGTIGLRGSASPLSWTETTGPTATLGDRSVFELAIADGEMVDVKIVRGNKQSIVTAMKGCRERLDRNVSVMLFPEGTRSHDGVMGEFKDGAFRLAIESGCPILPLVVAGTREAIQKGDWRWNVTSAEVRVLQPIETTGLTKDDVGDLRDRVRALISDELALMKA